MLLRRYDTAGLYGLSGRLTVQPEFQRAYLYLENGKDADVISSVLKGYPIGLLYFNVVDRDKGTLEVLDGQQRITSLGRFREGQFAVTIDGHEQNFNSLPSELREKFLKTELLAYECEGTEPEIKEWFKTINIAGIPLKEQELLNAVYSGTFVTAAKATFSNSKSAIMHKWLSYVTGDPKRQDILAIALKWIAAKQSVSVSGYMAAHRGDPDCAELREYFEAVIGWVEHVFVRPPDKEMRGQPWADFYETYHEHPYDPTAVDARVEELRGDPAVHSDKGIYEYVLAEFAPGVDANPKLLDIRIFEDSVKKQAYKAQTTAAKAKSVSNCSVCEHVPNSNQDRIYKFDEMEADHVTAWSKGGASTLTNCEMLCMTHNRAKGNR
ncbi:HNH endonuclease family protein [Gordonia sp. SND2]|uniref:HNH endonuclease family protein n=1 Tax=Gordonia sp. SND2 TaxID=3388659 RepID=UPI00398A66E6